MFVFGIRQKECSVLFKERYRNHKKSFKNARYEKEGYRIVKARLETKEK